MLGKVLIVELGYWEFLKKGISENTKGKILDKNKKNQANLFFNLCLKKMLSKNEEKNKVDQNCLKCREN